jgi:hypothetical protein
MMSLQMISLAEPFTQLDHSPLNSFDSWLHEFSSLNQVIIGGLLGDDNENQIATGMGLDRLDERALNY